MSAFNRSLSASAWDCISIDGKDCQACFFQREITTGRDTKTSDCWIELPRCQCPECRVFCGSKITLADGRQFETTELGTTRNADCIRWYVKEVCTDCD